MKRSLIGLGLTVAAATLGAAIVGAQAQAPSDDQQRRADQRIVAPQARGGMGPGRAMGQGRAGAMQGLMLRRGGPLGPRGMAQMGRGDAQSGRGMAMRGGRGPAMRGMRGAGGGLAALNLTEEQRSKVTGLQRAERDQAAPLRDELAVTRRSLHRELFADDRNAGRIAELTASIAKLEQQLADLRVKTATAVADVLTAEQRETMRLHNGRGRGPGRAGPAGAGPARGGGRMGAGPRGGGR